MERFSAVIQYELSNGSIDRVCQLCQLHVNSLGDPHPYFYSQTWIANFFGDGRAKCDHIRPSAHSVRLDDPADDGPEVAILRGVAIP